MKIYTDTILFPKVLIYTSVLNEKGYPVISLSPEDFTLYEDNKKAGKSDTVLHFPSNQTSFSLLLIDVSKNMKKEDIITLKILLWEIHKKLSEKQKIGIALFADTLIPLLNPEEKINLESAKRRFDKIRRKLKSKKAKILDAIHTSLSKLQEEIKNYSLKQKKEIKTSPLKLEEKIKNFPFLSIVVLSKGIDDGSKSSLENLKEISIKTQIPVFTVGINEKNTFLSQISDVTGGEHISGKNAKEILSKFDDLRLKITNSIILLYTTQILPGDNKPHLLEVEVQNVKGAKTFITPPKRILRFKNSYLIISGFAILILILFILYGKFKIRRRKIKEEISIPPFEAESKVIEEKPIIEEKIKKPEIIRKEKPKTQILPPYIEVQVKRYDRKESIIYKNKTLTTDTEIEIEYNKSIKIGSEKNNDLILPGIKPLHLILKCEYAGLFINAMNKVYINGEEVKGEIYYNKKGKYVINVGPYVLLTTLK